MEKYFLYLVLVSLTGYTRGKPGPFNELMTCYNCVKVLEGQYNTDHKKCDEDYSTIKSKAVSSSTYQCIAVNKTVPSGGSNTDDTALISELSINSGGCKTLGEFLSKNCTQCKEPRCNNPLSEAKDADMIECYECEDKDIIDPCNPVNITKSKTTKKDSRIYSCYTITRPDKSDNDRFAYEKDFCEVLKDDPKYGGQKIDCKECSASLCNTDGYVATATEKPKINVEVSVGDEGIGIQIGTTTSPGKSSASKIVLKYFYVIYFALYCGQYKYNSFLRRLY